MMKIIDPENDPESYQRYEEMMESLGAKAYEYHEIWEEFDKLEGLSVKLINFIFTKGKS
jgi:uncharacterized protein YfbU (UPF0304 family)